MESKIEVSEVDRESVEKKSKKKGNKKKGHNKSSISRYPPRTRPFLRCDKERLGQTEKKVVKSQILFSKHLKVSCFKNDFKFLCSANKKGNSDFILLL